MNLTVVPRAEDDDILLSKGLVPLGEFTIALRLSLSVYTYEGVNKEGLTLTVMTMRNEETVCASRLTTADGIRLDLYPYHVISARLHIHRGLQLRHILYSVHLLLPHAPP